MGESSVKQSNSAVLWDLIISTTIMLQEQFQSSKGL